MTWKLKREYKITSDKAGKIETGVSYLMTPTFGMVSGWPKPEGGMDFASKSEAAAYAKKHAAGHGYKPVYVGEAPAQ